MDRALIVVDLARAVLYALVFLTPARTRRELPRYAQVTAPASLPR
ncbi:MULTISPECIES: hypothetical protein [unclassified Streptomyces]